jgi:calcium-binding protein CML
MQEETKEELRQVFLSIDEDHNGEISAEELHELIKKCGVDCTLQQIKVYMEKYDKDANGSINFEEFLKMN